MFDSLIQRYFASRSIEEVLNLFGGPDEFGELVIAGFVMCSPETKQRLRQAFFGKANWEKIEAFLASQ